MKRFAAFWCLSIAAFGLCGCVPSLSSQQPPATRTAGFWFWGGSSAQTTWFTEPVDVLFVQVGSFSQESKNVYGELPERLPPAKEFWFVFRFEQQGLPSVEAVSALAHEVSRLQASAKRRHLDVAGIQLDIDCPTAALPQYAAFLREIRKELPQGLEISITALLDWFRSGTPIAEVIGQVDEFVPQFYDVGSSPTRESIAARIDASRWGPVFNRFRKRFRVGISTFGRGRVIPRPVATGERSVADEFYGDLTPLDVAANPSFQLGAARNAAQELVLRYRVITKARVGYHSFSPGDTVQFVLATPESVRTAMASAQALGGYFAGVVFFRWPSSDEKLAMQPDEVLIAAGLRGEDRRLPRRIHRIDGRCAAVDCFDLYLEGADPFSPKPARYRIRTSTELEYFLPDTNMAARMTGPSQIELSVPPYCGRGHLYLGRAVTLKRAEYTIEETQ